MQKWSPFFYISIIPYLNQCQGDTTFYGYEQFKHNFCYIYFSGAAKPTETEVSCSSLLHISFNNVPCSLKK